MSNIPNILTVFRILLVPVFLFLIIKGDLMAATVVFAVAGATDAIDGFIARTFNFKTELGAQLDPFADKFLLLTAYVALTAKGILPLWLCVPVIVRDFIILAGVFYLRAAGRKVAIQPTIPGKLTTTLQIATVVYAMVLPHSREAAFLLLSGLTALLTVYTGFDYSIREFRIQYRK